MPPPNYETAAGRLSSRGLLDEKSSTASIPIVIRDATDELDARQKALAIAPANYDGQVQESVDVIERVNSSTYYVTVNYQHPDRDQPALRVGEYRVSFDTGGQTSRVHFGPGSAPFDAIHKDGAGSVIPFGTAIRVVGERVEGADQVIPGLKVRVNKRFAGSAITDAFVRTLAELTGSLNDATFLGYGEGELLLLGVQGEQGEIGGSGSPDTDPELVYDFLVAFDGTNEELDGITIPNRPGHAVTWTYYIEEDVADYTSPRTQQVNIVEIYPKKDFLQLGIV